MAKALDEFGPQVGILLYVDAERKKLNDREDELKLMEENALQIIQEAIGKEEEATYKNKPVITWKVTRSRRFSQKEFAADHPDLLEEYKRETESRSFRVVGNDE
jgi:hypothetical protein